MNDLMDIALKVSCNSSNKYHKHGALLIRNNEIIGSGCNDENRHAEYNAILSWYRLL